jgi:N-acetylglucosaminyldiphosphoundecaprenol N-acetyl-beta-D-mannosaminyltransferase
MIAQAEVAAPSLRRILGQRIDDLSWEDCLSLLAGWSHEPALRAARQVITLNPEHVMTARRNAAFHEAIETADLVTCDGVGLFWAGRLLGQPLRAVIPGSELLPRLAAMPAARPPRWFLLGGGEGVAEAAAATLRLQPGSPIIAGVYGGSPRTEDFPAILARLEEAAPIDLLWVAYGSPAQELWIARHRAHLPVRIAIGVGGALDFLAGNAAPPPTWVRRAGLIWLFRLWREPWRWRRQLVLGPFVFLTLREAGRRCLVGRVNALTR